MRKFTMHNALTGAKVSEFDARPGARFSWPDGAHGYDARHLLERAITDPEDPEIITGHWRIYENVMGRVGEGPNESESPSVFNGTNYVVTVTHAPESATFLRARLLARVNSMRLEKVSAGLVVAFAAGTLVKAPSASDYVALATQTEFVLQTDDYSRENIDRAAIGVSINVLPLNADGTPNNTGTGTHISWRMRDNSDVLVDGPTYLAKIGIPLGLHVSGCHLTARAHKAAIEAAADVDLPAYDLAPGWPAVAPAE